MNKLKIGYLTVVVFFLLCLVLNILGILPYVFTSVSFLIVFCAWIIWNYFRQSSNEKKVTLFIFAAVLICLIPFVGGWTNSATALSRLATMGSLAHNNTFELTGQESKMSSDMIYVNEKYFSSKPPVFPFIGSGVYWMISKTAGTHLVWPFDFYYWITLFLVTIPTALAAVLFYKILSFTKIDDKFKAVLIVALIFGTLIFSYSGHINTHTTAAALLLAGLYFFFNAQYKDSINSAVASGFFFALAGTFDLPSFIWFAGFGFLLFLKKRTFCKWYLAGAALPLIFYFAFTYQIKGNLMPHYLGSKNSYDWPGSPWEQHNREIPLEFWAGLWKMTIGERGIFTFTPLFIFGLLGVYSQIRKRERFWREAVCVAVCIVIALLLYAWGSRGYGGTAYGLRWLIPLAPFFMFFAAVKLEEQHGVAWYFLFVLLLLYSALMAYVGAIHTWEIIPPLFFFKSPF